MPVESTFEPGGQNMPATVAPPGREQVPSDFRMAPAGHAPVAVVVETSGQTVPAWQAVTAVVPCLQALVVASDFDPGGQNVPGVVLVVDPEVTLQAPVVVSTVEPEGQIIALKVSVPMVHVPSELLVADEGHTNPLASIFGAAGGVQGIPSGQVIPGVRGVQFIPTGQVIPVGGAGNLAEATPAKLADVPAVPAALAAVATPALFPLKVESISVLTRFPPEPATEAKLFENVVMSVELSGVPAVAAAWSFAIRPLDPSVRPDMAEPLPIFFTVAAAT